MAEQQRGPLRGPASHRHHALVNQKSNSSLGQVLERLDGVRRSGKGFTARCPSHQDKSPSLSITEGRDGRLLVYCFAGCEPDGIVNAIGLTMSDLFADACRRPPTTRFRRRHHPVPRRVALALSERQDFAFEWKLAKILARVPEPLAQRDVLGSWDFLVDRVNLPLVITLSRAVREVGI